MLSYWIHLAFLLEWRVSVRPFQSLSEGAADAAPAVPCFARSPKTLAMAKTSLLSAPAFTPVDVIPTKRLIPQQGWVARRLALCQTHPFWSCAGARQTGRWCPAPHHFSLQQNGPKSDCWSVRRRWGNVKTKTDLLCVSLMPCSHLTLPQTDGRSSNVTWPSCVRQPQIFLLNTAKFCLTCCR